MGASPRISVIVNNFNYEAFVADAIQSATGQSYSNKEVILVDDGSTDGSVDLAERKFGEELIVISKENGGQASALNLGLEQSSGEAVVFLDSDDLLLPDALEKLALLWRKTASKIHFKLKCIDKLGSPLGFTKPRASYALPHGPNVWHHIRDQGCYVTSPTSGNLFSRQFLEDVMPINPEHYRISADNYLNYTAPFYGDVIAIDDCLGCYRIHGSNHNYARGLWSRPRAKYLAKQLEVTDLTVKRLLEEKSSSPKVSVLEGTARNILIQYIAGNISLFCAFRNTCKLRNQTHKARLFSFLQLLRAGQIASIV